MEMGRLYFDSQGANLNFHGNKPALCKPGNYFTVPHVSGQLIKNRILFKSFFWITEVPIKTI